MIKLEQQEVEEIASKVAEVKAIHYITLDNVGEFQQEASIIVRRRVSGSNTKPLYRLERAINLKLSDGSYIHIPSGFIWDLSSVPRLLWGLLPPDGDFELASLIHDYLYITKIKSRKFADDEMLKWSKATAGTDNKWSIRNFDNQLRYIAVRLFGWAVWNKRK